MVAILASGPLSSTADGTRLEVNQVAGTLCLCFWSLGMYQIAERFANAAPEEESTLVSDLGPSILDTRLCYRTHHCLLWNAGNVKFVSPWWLLLRDGAHGRAKKVWLALLGVIWRSRLNLSYSCKQNLPSFTFVSLASLLEGLLRGFVRWWRLSGKSLQLSMAQGAATARPSKQPQHRGGLNNSEQQYRNATQRNIDEATTAYIKRVLCATSPEPASATTSTAHEPPTEPLDQLLPPLTSSNEVDVQLYAFIAVILNVFVQSWYNRITSDQEFVAWIVQIIAHCTRELEQRLRHVDLESLLLDELPELLTEHINGEHHSRTGQYISR